MENSSLSTMPTMVGRRRERILKHRKRRCISHISSPKSQGFCSWLNPCKYFQNFGIAKDENIVSNDYALPDDRRCVDGCIKLQFQVEVKSGIRQGEELPTNCTESRREETRDDTCIFHTLTSIHHRFSISQTRSRCIASRFWRMRIQWPVIMCVDCSAELQLQVRVGR